MGLDKAFIDLMPITISVKHQTGTNEYDEPTYGNPVEYRARYEPTHRILRGPEGTELTVSARLIVDAQGTLRPTDLVTLPDGSTPLVQSVDTEYDENTVFYQAYLLDG